MMNKDEEPTENQIIHTGASQLERRSNTLVFRGLKDLEFLTNNSHSAPTAIIGDIFGAVEVGDIGLVRAILTADPSQVNSLNEQGETPLFPSVRFGFVEIAKLLVLKGANPNAHDSAKYFDDDYGWSTYDTPLHIAAYRKQTVIAEFLLNNGSEVNSEDWCGRTPLFIAANNADETFTQLLLRYGATVKARNLETGDTPLHYAVRGRDGLYDTKIMALLIENGADVNAANKWGAGPLHYAADWGRMDAAITLLSHGADPNLRDSRGMTPFDKAICLKNADMLELLEEYDIDPISRKSFLTREELRRNPKVFAFLSDRGFEYYRAGTTDRSKWHAALYRDAEAVKAGLGDDLEQHFENIWAAITGEVDYVGGTGGVYGVKSGTAGSEATGMPVTPGPTGVPHSGIQSGATQGAGRLGQSLGVSGGAVAAREAGIPAVPEGGNVQPAGGGAGKEGTVPTTGDKRN